MDQKCCGTLSLYFLYCLDKGKDYYDTIFDMLKWSLEKLFVNEHGDDMKGILDMKNNKIINVAEPTDIKDVTTKKYVDDSVNTSQRNM
jgi:hypothetical protein